MTSQVRNKDSRHLFSPGKWFAAVILALAFLFLFHEEARAQSELPNVDEVSGGRVVNEQRASRGPVGLSREKVEDSLDDVGFEDDLVIEDDFPAEISEGGESAADGLEIEAEGEEDVVEREKEALGDIMSLFRNDAEDDSQDEKTFEEDRRIKELERFAVRNFERSRLSESKKNLNDLITLKPYESYYHFALGLCFRKEGRFQDALKKYQDVLDLGGPKPLVRILMAEAWAQDGDRDKVFEHLEEAAVGGRNIIHDVQSLTVLEQYKTNTDFIKLALSLEKYEIRSKPKQDPLTNPFPMRDPVVDSDEFGVGKQDDNPTSLNPDEQEKLLIDSRKAYDRVLWYIKLEDEDKAMENYTQLRKYMDQKELLTIPKIKNDFERLASRMETLEAQIEGIRLKFYYNQALGQLKKLKQAFYDAEYKHVERLFGELQKVADEMLATNERYMPVAKKVLESGRVWVTRTQIRQEFEANKPKIEGIIIASDTKMALVNGTIVNQGEHFGSFFVQKVENNRITFRYKGEEIPLVFRRY